MHVLLLVHFSELTPYIPDFPPKEKSLMSVHQDLHFLLAPEICMASVFCETLRNVVPRLEIKPV